MVEKTEEEYVNINVALPKDLSYQVTKAAADKHVTKKQFIILTLQEAV